MNFKHSLAYSRGYGAFHGDIAYLDNPYKPDTPEWRDWRCGWNIAHGESAFPPLSGEEPFHREAWLG